MIEVGKGYYKQSAHGQTLEAHEDQHRRNLICSQYGDVAGTLEARHDSSACADRGQNVICVHGSQDPIINTETANPVQLNQGQENVICYGIGNGQLHEACRPEKEVSKTLDGMHDHGAVLCYDARGNGDGETANCITGDHGDRVTDYTPLVSEGRMFVRRLTPVECERLMGFPDNWTQIPWRGKPAEDCPDGPRYKACGNSMCVNVMRWIGMRIEQAERRTK